MATLILKTWLKQILSRNLTTFSEHHGYDVKIVQIQFLGCKASTLQGETHRHQYKPDRIYTGAYTKVQMSSLSKNRLKRRYICWHHQREMPNNYKYPRGSNNVRGE